MTKLDLQTAAGVCATLRHVRFQVWHTAIVVFTLWLVPCHADTFYVAKAGSDKNPGTQSAPWLTITKAANSIAAGDTVIIEKGDYEEHVQETTSGFPDNYITFRSAEPRAASVRAFRLSGEFIKIDGLTIDRFSGVNNSWGAAVRVDPNAHNCIITNCAILDAPKAIAHDFSFDGRNNEIRSPSSDFVEAGFKPGSKVYLGASGLDGYWYTNHDTGWIIASNKSTSMWVTNTSGEKFQPDAGSNYWAAIRAGAGSGGFYAVNFVLAGGTSATNVVFSGNLISNWIGHAISLSGHNNRIENNTVTELHSFRFLSFSGNNHVIRSNIVKNSPNILHYTGSELSSIIHPAGTGWYDYQVGMIGGFTSTIFQNTNTLIEGNWFENIENQIGRVDDEKEETYDITYRNNVFIGVAAHFSGGRDGMKWLNNTFYRCTWTMAGHPLQLGGRPPSQKGYEITRNLFIDCGGYESYEYRGWYFVSTNALSPLLDFNMVASAELTGYAPKRTFDEPNGINGGDPGFLSVTEPAGPDGIPFTEDDGLKLLPNSPAAKLGAGALGTFKVINNVPVAHFRITSPQGWFEPVGLDYDPEWLKLPPTRRGQVQRPFDTPSLIGNAPLTATFNAEMSISGVNGSVSTSGITSYIWSFGDGTIVTTPAPQVAHTFTKSGDMRVCLTVQNTAGNTHSACKIYRVGSNSNDGTLQPRPPLNLRKL